MISYFWMFQSIQTWGISWAENWHKHFLEENPDTYRKMLKGVVSESG